MPTPSQNGGMKDTVHHIFLSAKKGTKEEMTINPESLVIAIPFILFWENDTVISDIAAPVITLETEFKRITDKEQYLLKAIVFRVNERIAIIPNLERT